MRRIFSYRFVWKVISRSLLKYQSNVIVAEGSQKRHLNDDSGGNGERAPLAGVVRPDGELPARLDAVSLVIQTGTIAAMAVALAKFPPWGAPRGSELTRAGAPLTFSRVRAAARWT